VEQKWRGAAWSRAGGGVLLAAQRCMVWLLLGSGGVDHDLNAGMPSPRASFGEVDVAWWRYEEADAERHCKVADAEGVTWGRRTVLVRREGGAVSE